MFADLYQRSEILNVLEYLRALSLVKYLLKKC